MRVAAQGVFMGSGQKLKVDNSVIIGSRCLVMGNNNVINGDDAIVYGNNCVVNGSNAEMHGANNIQNGRNNNIANTIPGGIVANRNNPMMVFNNHDGAIIGNNNMVMVNNNDEEEEEKEGKSKKSRKRDREDEEEEEKQYVEGPIPDELKYDLPEPSSDLACIICLERKRICIALPCLHHSYCVHCARVLCFGKDGEETIKEEGQVACAVCREKVKSIKRTF